MQRYNPLRAVRGLLSREKGQALPLFAAGLVGFCGLVGLSIDVGQLVFTATDMQKIADASALAAGQDLPGTTTATATANSYATQNGGATLAIAFTDSNRTVTVEASRYVDYTFLKVIGLSGKTVKRSATVHAEQEVVTGYNLENTAPFVIWGGSRQNEVNPGDQNCPYHVCVGKSYTIMDSNWMNASGKPKLPDWTANDSNNFKGDINHGDGGVVHNGETMSVGGLGSVEVPAVGTILVIPVVSKASGNSDMRTFTVAAWVQVQVQPGCTKNGCKAKVLDPSTTAPQTGWVGGGSTQPPPTLTYKGTTTTLTK